MKNARLVCHSWYEASQDRKIIDKEILNFSCNGTASGVLTCIIPTLVNSSREFFHFLFKVSCKLLRDVCSVNFLAYFLPFLAGGGNKMELDGILGAVCSSFEVTVYF